MATKKSKRQIRKKSADDVVASAPDTRPAAKPHDGKEDLAERSRPAFMIAGIGASAGGLEACTQLLHALTPGDHMGYVLIQHLHPTHESLFSSLLQAATTVRVVEASDDMPVEPGRVHVIPPNTLLTIVDGRLRLQPRPVDHVRNMPVDLFFRSLAEYAQDRAVAVVLSGSASDGAAGLREIKAAGGITLVQDPLSARFDGMPRAAIATGAADLVLPPDRIAEELGRIASHTFVPRPPVLPQAEPADNQEGHLERIFLLLRNASGVDFTHYKRPTILRRLQRRMVVRRASGYDQYITYLEKNPQEVLSLYQDLLIHVTRFFREPDSFGLLVERVFPDLLKHHKPGQPIRVWVPGCSTGEEAYSVAIALLEFLGDRSGEAPIQIFATDISEQAVDHARAGLYAESIVADVSPERLRRFFTKSDGGYRVVKQVRDTCIFARQDLTRDPPFSRLDLIICRNVLIYLGPVLQKRLINGFGYGLKPGRYLMLGSAESVGAHADLFTIADRRHKLYVRKANAAPAELGRPAGSFGPSRPEAAKPAAAAAARAASNVQSEASRILLARYTPPGVIVDNDLQITQFRGQTGAFLEPAPGEASLNLLKMTREGLLYGLRTAIAEARRTESTVRREGLRVRSGGALRDVNVEVVPLTDAAEGPHFLILFQEAAAPPAPVETPEKPRGRRNAATRDAATISRLQQELAASREHLQTIIQDLEAANEELQSANEEILSSNEELQSTNEELDTAKEELQSTNEELNTLNEELQGRNEELSRANSDLLNLLASVQIAIVMVAGDLRIRRFTPTAERVLNLIPTDIGRPISDIKPNIDCPDLEHLITEAIDSISIRQRQVQDRDGRWFSLQVRPYKNVENRIDGAVVVLFDAQEAVRQARSDMREAQQAADYVDAIFQTVRQPLLVLDAELHVKDANRAFYRTFATNPAETLNRTVLELGDGRWNVPALRVLLEEVLPEDKFFEGHNVENPFPRVGKKRMMLNGRRIDATEGRPALILLAIEEIAEPRS